MRARASAAPRRAARFPRAAASASYLPNPHAVVRRLQAAPFKGTAAKAARASTPRCRVRVCASLPKA